MTIKTTTTINRCRKKSHDSFSLPNRCHNSVNSENAENKTLGFVYPKKTLKSMFGTLNENYNKNCNLYY